MMNSASDKKLVRTYIAFQFFFGMLLWLPIFYAYQEKMGLSAAEIFRIQSLYQIAFCLVEIPTGWFADRRGFLSAMKIGSITLIIANFLPVFWVDYPGFLTHFLLIALARSFVSGASSAYLYEALKQRGHASSYKHIEGEGRAYGLVGKVIGWAGVGTLMSWQVSSPYWITTLFSIGALIAAIALPKLRSQWHDEASVETAQVAKSGSLDLVVAAIRELRERPVLNLVMLQGVAIFVLARLMQVTLFQPLLQSKGWTIETFGPVMSAMTLFEAIGSWKPHWIRRWFGDLHAVTVITVILGVLTAVFPLMGAWGLIAGLCLFSLFIGLSFPLQKQVMNDAITGSSSRATLLSIESIIDRASSALVTLLLAGIMASGKLDAFLRDSGLVTIVGVIFIGIFAARALQKEQSASTVGESERAS